MNHFHKNSTFRYSMPYAKLLAYGIVSTLTGIAVTAVICLVAETVREMPGDLTRFNPVFLTLDFLALVTLVPGIHALFLSFLVFLGMSDASRIKYSVRKRLYSHAYGNPLHLKEGEQICRIKCKKEYAGRYALAISATSRSIEDIMKLSSPISSMLRNRYRRFAVTSTVADLNYNNVVFYIEDVTVDNSLIVRDVRELCPKDPAKIRIDKVHSIDLRYSQSILCAGKTRSGKTTAVISLLIQTLLLGKDEYGSRIVIIDPKQAELSRLPHTFTLDEDGGAKTILKTMREFADTITRRQKILNDLSEKQGNAVKWWDAGMKPSFLFLDEYVALRSLFPKRPSKDEPDYCLAEFDALLKRIVTMGASTGSYAIISIAEASVDESSGGGIPAMIRSACTTKILFKPTLPEARLLWNSETLADFNNGRIYRAGEAWYSSTDGIHDMPSYVHFPVMDIPEYRELGRLLKQYYDEK